MIIAVRMIKAETSSVYNYAFVAEFRDNRGETVSRGTKGNTKEEAVYNLICEKGSDIGVDDVVTYNDLGEEENKSKVDVLETWLERNSGRYG